MCSAALPLTEMPSPRFVMSADGHRIATYTWGDDSAPTVLCVHGFASNCRDNWVNTGWVRDLTRGGFGFWESTSAGTAPATNRTNRRGTR